MDQKDVSLLIQSQLKKLKSLHVVLSHIRTRLQNLWTGGWLRGAMNILTSPLEEAKFLDANTMARRGAYVSADDQRTNVHIIMHSMRSPDL